MDVADRYPLARFAGEPPPAPAWFRDIMSHQPEVGFVEVAGAQIEMLTWGEIGRPGILLVHGNFAHAYWWGPIAPLLARDFRVCALSMSGMGGSSWRAAYTIDTQVDEMLAVAEAACLFAAETRPTVVAHSYGAEPAAICAARYGDRFSGAILLDDGVAPKREEAPLTSSGRSYPSMEAALARFRLAPPQEHSNLFILDEIARRGLKLHEDGQWRWKFDPQFWQKLANYDTWSLLPRPKCPLTFVYAANSTLVSRERVELQRSQTPPGTPFIPIEGAGHHLMIDQPFAVLAAIYTSIAEVQRAAR